MRGQNVIISAMLLDIVMPVMDGYAVLEQMESDPQLPHIPVIVLSQADKLESEDKALALGASDFVQKPYKPSVLLRRLSNLIEQYESTERIARMERDALTGLYSKDAFFRRAAERIAESPDDSYILVATDIERFKLVNDTYSNVVGDKLLKFISGGLQRDIDKKDGVCARFGADQFVMLIPDADNFNVERWWRRPPPTQTSFPTCAIISDWISKGNKYVPVSVNVSHKDIYKEDLPEYLSALVARHSLRPSQLHLEITESAYTENSEQLIGVVSRLKALGFTIEMDDFGS